jgi:hypothetical protein
MNKCGKMSHVIQCKETYVCFLGEFFFGQFMNFFEICLWGFLIGNFQAKK